MRFACFTIVIVFALGLFGLVEAEPPAGVKPPPKPTRIALIDMAEVFRKYQGFIDDRAAFKNEVAVDLAKAKARLARIESLKKEHGRLPSGSPEARKLAEKLTDLLAECGAYQKKLKQRFQAKESEIYKATYLKAQQQIDDIARERGITQVLRFNRQGVEEAKDPKTILGRMNRLVVVHDKSIDITNRVLAEMNQRYKAGE